MEEASCQGCHPAQVEQWRGSHHHLAMQRAVGRSVLGDFDETSLQTDVETSRFYRRGADFLLNSPGPGGRLEDHQVEFTIGVEPLQQYLIRLAGGRLQVHGAAWDVPAARWFHLYDGEGVDHRHRLHWSKAQQNADFMCVECHTTGFQRGYDPAADTYASSWHALGVGCQSCHGPASHHLRWAEGETTPDDGARGFRRSIARRGDPLQVQTCARCHSRRTPLGNGYDHGSDLLDDYLPMILTADLYEVDGKIKDEVFEYGSFVQSRMHAVGVICSDCHDPHSAKLRAEGNAVCTQCHNQAATAIRSGIDSGGLQAKAYDDPSHHHHAAGSAGSLCVSCHMQGKLYMGNDLRHDHSFSSPLPSQALELSHSDPCLGCHQEDGGKKVLAAFERWYPEASPRDGGYARALHAARGGGPGAGEALLRQLASRELPDIRRATLLSELPNHPSAAAQRAVVEALQDPSPLVRRSAAEVLGALLPPHQQLGLLTGLLRDPVRAVRLAASWNLLQLPHAPDADQAARRALVSEYEEMQNTMLDRAESHYNLAGVYAATGRQTQVEASLRRALERDPSYHPATILLAQWQEQAMGDAEGAMRTIREAIELAPKEAALHHAIGLMYVRQGRRAESLLSLRMAHQLGPETPDHGYVLAVALHDSGNPQAALSLLREQIRLHPTHRPLRQTLVTYLRAAGEHKEAEDLQADWNR